MAAKSTNKAILLICDGLGDRPITEFGNLTPLEAAKTPNMDRLAKEGLCGLIYPAGRGITPGSDIAHLGLFGYEIEKFYDGRGPIEVVGLGIELKAGDICFRGNFGTADSNGIITDRRAGRIKDVSMLTPILDGLKIEDVQFIVRPGTAYRMGVVMRGPGLSEKIADIDPGEVGKPLKSADSGLDDPAAKKTARILNEFAKKASALLEEHPINRERTELNLPLANTILLRGGGYYRHVPTFKDRYGLNSACVAGGGLYKGLGAYVGMDVIPVNGATGTVETDIPAKFKKTVELLSEYDFIYLHVKATDSLGEDNNPTGKRDFIERIDQALAELEKRPENTLLIITGDHSTPCAMSGHSSDSVPLLMHGLKIRRDRVEAFGETACINGGLGIFDGKFLMPEILNQCSRAEKFGS